MTDISGIEPITIDADYDKLMAEFRYLTGEEIDLLDGEGIRFEDDVYAMRLAVGIGWLKLRRDHPGLSYVDGRKLVRIDLSDTDEAPQEEPHPVDPPAADG